MRKKNHQLAPPRADLRRNVGRLLVAYARQTCTALVGTIQPVRLSHPAREQVVNGKLVLQEADGPHHATAAGREREQLFASYVVGGPCPVCPVSKQQFHTRWDAQPSLPSLATLLLRPLTQYLYVNSLSRLPFSVA